MKLLWFNLRTDIRRQGLAFAIDWLNTFAEHVEQIDVITMHAGDYQRRDNVRVYSVGKEKGYNELRRFVEFYRILFSLLIHNKYDACFAHMMPLFAAMAAPFLRAHKIPLVLWYTHKSITLILRLATLFANRVITASKESFRIPTQKVRIIGHGIDTDKFTPAEKVKTSNGQFTVLTVTRLSPIKRVDLLIKAVALLRLQRPELSFCLKIVGGPLTDRDHLYVAELEKQVKQYQLRDSIVFTGSIPFQEIVPHYQQADCFINMSETGSIDKTVLEAMSCGIAVIVNPVFIRVLDREFARKWVINWDAQKISDRLQLLATMSASERQRLGIKLRAIVVRDHRLNDLCRNILREIEIIIK